MERNIICFASPQSSYKSIFIAYGMFEKLVYNFERFGGITTGAKASDWKAKFIKLAHMPQSPPQKLFII